MSSADQPRKFRDAWRGEVVVDDPLRGGYEYFETGDVQKIVLPDMNQVFDRFEDLILGDAVAYALLKLSG